MQGVLDVFLGDEQVKRTIKERAVMKAAKISKKHKIFKPFILLGLGVVLAFLSVGKYFFNNGKRYISIGLVLLFFVMSSSFATPKQVSDNEVYLQTGKITEINDEKISLTSGELLNEEGSTQIMEEDFLSEDLLTEEQEKELESTENIDKFTLEDFYYVNAISDVSSVSQNVSSGFDKNDWSLLLVNKTHPVPDDYEVKLTTLKGSMKCDERVVEPLMNMLNQAVSDGVNLYVCSPYRDFQRQEMLFLRKIDLYMSYGKSYLEAYKIASRDVIVPGCSEHQLGIAFDIVVDYHAVLDEEFGDTKAGKWLKDHCAEYGFILRYPKGKEHITGIVYEPWHFRYVGVDAATYIMENDITLEEFLEEID